MHQLLIKPVLALSGIGLMLSVVVHVAALLGVDLHLGQSVFALHMGIFVVWLPAMVLAMRMGRGEKNSAWGFGTRASWKHLLSGCPHWMKYTFYGLFVYVFLNFFLSIATMGDEPQGGDPSPHTIRMFSGHWLVFYYAAFAIAWSALMKPELLSDAVCTSGHKASPADKFCSQCGGAVVIKDGR